MPPADGRGAAERVWYGRGAGARLARAALTPASLLYALGMSARNALYGAGVLPRHALDLPAVSVGNLSVGGTGKTPVAAWVAGELARRGARPAIVLRGYGDDEPEVHRRLNPQAIVVVDPDRAAGVRTAAAGGADVAVLDDAFQHRRARRDVDLVLVSADRWTGRVRWLPAGPFREGLGALGRATLAVVTRKAASAEEAGAVMRSLSDAAPGCAVAQVHLAPESIVNASTGARDSVSILAGRRVLAICGVGDPRAFTAQLKAAGADVTLRAFADHHAFTDADIGRLAADARDVTAGGGLVLCTLKDAVKLEARWPAGEPALSFLSQQVIVEAGREMLDRLLDSVLAARQPAAAADG